MALGKFGTGLAVVGMMLNVQAAEAQDNTVNFASSNPDTLSLPHPDGNRMVDISKISFETQAQILGQLETCFQEGFDVADENGNGKLDNFDERDFFAYDQAGCVELAEQDFEIASIKADTAEIQKRVDANKAEIAKSRAKIAALTAQAMQDISNSQ